MCDDILDLDVDQKSGLASNDPGSKVPFSFNCSTHDSTGQYQNPQRNCFVPSWLFVHYLKTQNKEKSKYEKAIFSLGKQGSMQLQSS